MGGVPAVREPATTKLEAAKSSSVVTPLLTVESLSMILLTVPIFFPVVSILDFGLSPEESALWFGILVLIVVEVGLITPPVGMNLFIINAMDRRTSMLETYKAVMFFVGTDLIRVAILVAFPAIVLFLV